MATTPPPSLLFLDAETTGIDPDVDHLVEVAAQVTDWDGKPLTGVFHRIARTWPDQWRGPLDIADQWHTASGLKRLSLDAPLERSGRAVVENFVDFLRNSVPHRTMMAGCNVRFDRRWMEHYYGGELPVLHHRMVDISSIRELIRNTLGEHEVYRPGVTASHRAEADICFAQSELVRYRKLIRGR